MKEVQFIKNNSERWKEVELFLSKKTSFQDPDKLAELFIQLTDDLSYSKTFYPQSKTTQYLNTLASKIHQSVYKNKKEKIANVASLKRNLLKLKVTTTKEKLESPLMVQAM